VSMEIRLIEPKDWPQVIDLFNRGILPGMPTQSTTGVVLVEGEKVCGFAGLYFIPVVENFWLDKKYRNGSWLKKMVAFLCGLKGWKRGDGLYFFAKRPAEEKICALFGGEKRTWKVFEKVY